MYYNHPAFKDVYLEVLKSFYIKEKGMWSLKVVWWNKRLKWPLTAPYRIKLEHSKWREFKQIDWI